MAATLGTINPDTAHGQLAFKNQSFLLLPFTAISDGDTYQLDTQIGVTGVAFRPTAVTDIVSVTVDSDDLVTFHTDGVTSYAGDLLVFYGGASA